MMSSLLKWIVPWEFSWVFLLSFVAICALYVRGSRQLQVSFSRKLSFWTGMAIVYVSLHTYFDYYAEHEFFMHRIQQVLLHHLAPLLIVASYPGTVLRAGLPLAWRARALRPLERSWPWRAVTGVLLNPAVATVLFVGFILIWLIPAMQTLAMLDWRIYRFMNWSMMLSGLSYWWLVLDHRPRPPGRMTPGVRVLSPAITMSPQILAGAIVTFSKSDLYPIFEICGRAFAFNVLTGQLVGGVIMWVPAALIESIGGLLALRQWVRLSRNGRIKSKRQLQLERRLG
ncbi:cytochrome c oxidase assembly protein [Dyella sp. LX-66]|uniref:cytochrome c oxidase assembly protein n=1 Tax=unclassified Dyella TaxID=2634549 RepID=UPI001BE0ADA4|nr:MULTISPECIES: cytochrome c oxidase assembly protein [unclassified Dyella]MBT2119210.1 cytochrome c oxidase assembly protein [Dyella sp. LX-1]MBT2141581.1 cytochrome c oxidase assembly protein [Dyella sp. LX-66]